MGGGRALVGKAHALYGRCLKSQDYHALLQKHSVSEVAAYLKQQPYYSEALREVREDLIHRGQLEALLRTHMINTTGRLLRYAAPGSILPYMVARQTETELLLQCLRRLTAGTVVVLEDIPLWVHRYLSIDLAALSGTSSISHFMHILQHSDWRDILSPALFSDLPACEAALRTRFFELMLQQIAHTMRGMARADLEQLLKLQIDLYNCMVLYRLKRYYEMTGMQLQRYLISVPGLLSRATMRSLVESTDASELVVQLQTIGLFRSLSLVEEIDRFPDKARLLYCQRRFRFSSHPDVIVQSYLVLQELELANLITLIEGIRYGMSPGEIHPLLILPKER